MSSYDDKGYAKDLGKIGLSVVEIASTPTGNSILHSAATDPRTNPALAAALRMYSKHYLASQEGIPGEAEAIPVVLSYLRGENPNVRRMTVLGLMDAQGKVQGTAFVETYEIDKTLGNGEKLQGLTHSLTYAVTELPGNQTANMAFHVGILNALGKINGSLGQKAGDSVLAAEVNSFRDYDGKLTSNKTDDEFEIKTGLPRWYREAYTLGGKLEIITLAGRYNYSNILQINDTPPFLVGEEGQQFSDDIITASQLASNDLEAASQLLAPHLKNPYVYDGRGEPLYLTAESPDGKPLTVKQLQLHKAFQEKMVVSVACDLGIDDRELVLAARKHRNSGFGRMDDDYNELIVQLEVETRRSAYNSLHRSSLMKRDMDLMSATEAHQAMLLLA